MSTTSLESALAAEFVGTALLLATVVGSGIMAESLAGGNVALALLCNTLATGGILVALINALGGWSGAHFNPVVSVAMVLRGGLPKERLLPYLLVQTVGAFVGVAAAHLMFSKPILFASQHLRSSGAEVFSEAVATFGLLLTIFGAVRNAGPQVPFAVAGYIVAAYWFTASTSFANPAVTLARSMTDTFAGIAQPLCRASCSVRCWGRRPPSCWFEAGSGETGDLTLSAERLWNVSELTQFALTVLRCGAYAHLFALKRV